jgi:GAF domain-containing protein
MLADAAVPVLEAARRSDPTRDLPDLSPVTEWAGIERAIALAAEGGSEELQRITEAARRRFGVEIATVSLVDGDRLRYAVPGSLPGVVPLELTFCQYAVQEPEPMVVSDARRDPRFAGNPLLELGHVQFYAGHPLQSLSGEPIGTLCLMGVRPKSASSIDLGALRSLALEAQEELWRIERGDDVVPGQRPEKTTRSR